MAIECSWWFFPAVILSGWLSPVVFLLSCAWEILQKVVGLWL